MPFRVLLGPEPVFAEEVLEAEKRRDEEIEVGREEVHETEQGDLGEDDRQKGEELEAERREDRHQY